MVAGGRIGITRLLDPVSFDGLLLTEVLCLSHRVVVGRTLIHKGLISQFTLHDIFRCRRARGDASGIYQQIARQIHVGKVRQSLVVEQWRVELRRLRLSSRYCAILIVCSVTCHVAIAARKVDGRHALIGLEGLIILLRLGKDGVGVEVSHIHLTVAEVGRSTIDSVA